MTKSWLRGGLAVIVLGAGMFATLGESESGGDSATETGSATEKGEETKTTEAASTKDTPIPLGTETEVAAGWTLTVNSAELDGNATVAAANEFNTPEAGKQFVIVNVTVTNKSDQPGEPYMNMKMSLLPPSGVAEDPTILSAVPSEINTMAQMQPGASATGNVAFQVASADVGATVLLGQSQFTMDEAKDQKFFAIQ